MSKRTETLTSYLANTQFIAIETSSYRGGCEAVAHRGGLSESFLLHHLNTDNIQTKQFIVISSWDLHISIINIWKIV